MDTIFPINFSHTMMSDLWTCEFKWFRIHAQRLTGVERNGDLIAGGLFAKACEITRKAYFNDGLDEETAIDLGYTHILIGEDTKDELKTNERMAFLFKQYFKKFRMDSTLTPCKLVDGTHAIEYTFMLDTGIAHPEIPEQNIIFKGKLDGLYERTHIGNVVDRVVVDEKTTKSVRRVKGSKGKLIDFNAEEDQYRMDGQFIGYHWAARKLGVKTSKSLIRRIPVSAEYEAAYELVIPVSQIMLDRWESATFSKIGELIEKYKWVKQSGRSPADAFYPVYNKGCTEFAKVCPFYNGCVEPRGEDILASQYRQVVYHEGQSLTLDEYKAIKNIKGIL